MIGKHFLFQSLNRFLESMADRRLVAFSWDFAEAGPAKKIYKITGDGMACLEQWISTLRDYLNSIEALVNTADRMPEGLDRETYLEILDVGTSMKSKHEVAHSLGT
jgi:DNA-binding PadR family transcriptional regulator